MKKYSVQLSRLRELREAQGLSQVEMAEKLGIAKQNYNFIENGKRKVSLVMAKQIADIFTIPIEDIFFTH